MNFDPATRRVAGTVDIKYLNNSPDSLRQIWFKLYPNLYQKGAPRSRAIAPEDVGDGRRDLQRSASTGKPLTCSKLRRRCHQPARDRCAAPWARTRRPRCAPPTPTPSTKARTSAPARWSRGPTFVAYFFPRIAVYDDIDGWNRMPYTGDQEFYNDFCNFKAAITVPKNFVVWATGDLTNADQVLTQKYAQRLREAEQQGRRGQHHQRRRCPAARHHRAQRPEHLALRGHAT